MGFAIRNIPTVGSDRSLLDMVGFVHASWAGTNIEWWSSHEALKECNATK